VCVWRGVAPAQSEKSPVSSRQLSTGWCFGVSESVLVPTFNCFGVGESGVSEMCLSVCECASLVEIQMSGGGEVTRWLGKLGCWDFWREKYSNIQTRFSV
jgi:hypothetical protein